MDYGLVFFLLLLLLIILVDGKNFKLEGVMLLRRSKKGVDFIQSFGYKNQYLWNLFADIGIFLSFGVLGLWFLFKEYKKRKEKNILSRIFAFTFLYSVFSYAIYWKGNAISGAILQMFKIHLNSVNPLYLFYLVFIFSVLFGISGYSFSIVLLGGIAAVWNAIIGAHAKAPLQLVLPFKVSSSSIPVLSVPFDKWLIALLIIVVVHELSHAFVSAAQKIKIKSLGYGVAFFILPVGFAEPDEKQLEKAEALKKVRIYGAGSMANLATALVFAIFMVLLSISTSPFINHAYTFEGVKYNGLYNGTYAYHVLPKNGTICKINNYTLNNFTMFIDVLHSFKPEDNISLSIKEGNITKEYSITLSHNPYNKSLAFIGILNVMAEYQRNKSLSSFQKEELDVLEYTLSLLKWIVLLNIGIAIANLLPLIPLDGGLMIRDIFIELWSDKKMWVWINILTFIALLFALFSSLVGKFIHWFIMLF